MKLGKLLRSVFQLNKEILILTFRIIINKMNLIEDQKNVESMHYVQYYIKFVLGVRCILRSCP